MKDKLSASEALFAFCGWLTTRREATVMSIAHESSPIASLIKKFCEDNGLDDPRDGWERAVKEAVEEGIPKAIDSDSLTASEIKRLRIETEIKINEALCDLQGALKQPISLNATDGPRTIDGGGFRTPYVRLEVIL